MRFKLSWSWSSRADQTYSISEAVEGSCEPDFERQGVAERASERAEKTSAMVGKLIQLLHERGVMRDEDVLGLLSEYEKHE